MTAVTQAVDGQLRLALIGIAAALAPLFVPAPGHADRPSEFDATVAALESLPYQPAYVATGLDGAFSSNPVPVVNTPPAGDYTAGSIPGSDPTGATDAPPWPAIFKPVTITSTDGARLLGMVALHPGQHPGVVVVHGFNTHGSLSVIRWAAMLAATGYDVAAIDQRDFSAEYMAGLGYPRQLQTFGWKEAEDVLAAGAFLRAQPGVGAIGLVGFSEGAQNAVLAAGHDTAHIFDAAITFSGPADQDSQIYSTAAPRGCQTPKCSYPVTDALVALVVPPYTYTDPCAVLHDAASRYSTTPYAILADESPMHAQGSATIPLLNFYAADDSLVAPVNAGFMSAYEQGNPLQRTLLVAHGEHAYFFDRWWQQSAILRYFHDLLPGAPMTTTMTPTVNSTPGGTALSTQLLDPGSLSRSTVDSQLAPFVCDTSRSAPGRPAAPAPGSGPSSAAVSESHKNAPGAASSMLPGTGAPPAAAWAVALVALAVSGAGARIARRRRARSRER